MITVGVVLTPKTRDDTMNQVQQKKPYEVCFYNEATFAYAVEAKNRDEAELLALDAKRYRHARVSIYYRGAVLRDWHMVAP